MIPGSAVVFNGSFARGVIASPCVQTGPFGPFTGLSIVLDGPPIADTFHVASKMLGRIQL